MNFFHPLFYKACTARFRLIQVFSGIFKNTICYSVRMTKQHTLYLKSKSTGLFSKLKLIKRRKAYHVSVFLPGGFLLPRNKQYSSAWVSAGDLDTFLKRYRVLKNKPTKGQVDKTGWFGKRPPEWIK